MNKEEYIIAIIASVVIGAGLVFAAAMLLPAIQGSADASLEGTKTITTGSTDTGDVEVALTPIGFANGQLSVEISVNTHSVDLSGLDMRSAVVLENDGKRYSPVQAPRIQGHHNNGLLVFDLAGQQLKEGFTIKITGIPQERERVFAW